MVTSEQLGSSRLLSVYFHPALTRTERDENRIPRRRVRTDCTETTGRQRGPGLGPDQTRPAFLLSFQSVRVPDRHRAVRCSTAELGWTPGGCSCTCAPLTGGGLIRELLQSPRHVPGPGESLPVSACHVMTRKPNQLNPVETRKIHR